MAQVPDTWKSFSRTCWMLWGLNWGCSIYNERRRVRPGSAAAGHTSTKTGTAGPQNLMRTGGSGLNRAPGDPDLDLMR